MSYNTYPDGTKIPSSLPSSYQPAKGKENCGNCKHYNQGYCGYWGGPVKADYWCRMWKK